MNSLPIEIICNILEFWVFDAVDLNRAQGLSKNISTELKQRPIHFAIKSDNVDPIHKHRVRNLIINHTTSTKQISTPELLKLVHGFNLDRLKCSGIGLVGPMPVLPGVKHLNCSMNFLTGNIQAAEGIKTLICDFNRLSGNIPQIPGLKVFNCSWNQLSGSIPQNLNLNVFVCSNNRLSGQIPLLPNIKLLDCRNNMLTGEIPVLSGVLHLVVSGNKLSGCVPVVDGMHYFDFDSNFNLVNNNNVPSGWQ
jgi:Leucine-rich repeat (LRR) protein